MGGQLVKIVLVIALLGFGGAQRVASMLSNFLVEIGHDVEIVTANYAESPAYHLDDRITVTNMTAGGRAGIISLNTCVNLRRLIKSIHPDVVISFIAEMNTLTLLATRGLKIPVIVSERNDPHRVPINRIKRAARDIAYRFADGIVFQTPAAREYFNRDIQSRSTVIVNPLDIERLPESYQGLRKKCIVAVNKLEPQKNIINLVQAFALIAPSHPDYELVIYGEGSLRRQLTSLANSLGLANQVAFMGNRSDVLQSIADASLFVLASDYEGMPNALIEALAMGLPCIATDCPIGGPAMLIKHDFNGLLVPVDDHTALAQAMMELLDDASRARRLGSQALKIREIVEPARVVSEWESYINKSILLRNIDYHGCDKRRRRKK